MDDTLCFIPADESLIPTFVGTLRCFELIWGLCINSNESLLLSINIDDGLLHSCAAAMGCQIEKFPIKYLGAALSFKNTNSSQWDPLLAKFNFKIG